MKSVAWVLREFFSSLHKPLIAREYGPKFEEAGSEWCASVFSMQKIDDSGLGTDDLQTRFDMLRITINRLPSLNYGIFKVLVLVGFSS